VIRKLFLAVLAAILLCFPAFAKDQVRIAGFGDSLVHGYGLSPEEGFIPQMQRWLDAQSVSVQMINAGVSGDTTAGGAARVAWTLSDNVQGLIVVLGGNDLLRGIAPQEAQANLDAVVSSARAQGVEVLLVGMVAPGNFGPDYKASFDAIYPELAKAQGAMLYPNFFSALSDYTDDPAKLSDVMQPDGIHPNAKGVALIVEDMGPAVLDLIAAITKR
jgi:acyl-CoA thioesterase-1